MKDNQKVSLVVLLLILYAAIVITMIILSDGESEVANICKTIAIIMTGGVGAVCLILIVIIVIIYHVYQLITGKPLFNTTKEYHCKDYDV